MERELDKRRKEGNQENDEENRGNESIEENQETHDNDRGNESRDNADTTVCRRRWGKDHEEDDESDQQQIGQDKKDKGRDCV